ncbi:MAG: RagB/SusD family nutrient uptake outer membrane protein [Bacteroides sp.]|nr:RagB/SusD family nutrient uptake outer membrane protein [Roseburia sp.]MCM1346536.1 RagB/SusD family nutrient uptake outer membrane protein [Bacteroides sp.]MCM1421101.1 RagB/SusD family nutrient uptake outer membrane protein [Bacteroides sp.]
MKNIKNKIKILGLAAFAGFAVTSCDLEMLPLSEVVLENYWTNKSDVESVITSCYTGMSNTSFISKLIIWSELRSDNVQAGIRATESTDYRNMINGNLLESNGVACDWTVVYTAINRCNTVIAYAPQVQEKDPNYTESDLKANLAEVKAIRALCYFYLIRTYKDVPFVLDPSIDDTQEYQVPASKHENILDTLIMDLEEVKEFAPRKYVSEIDNSARITRNAIYSLLADMYLWRASDANVSQAKAREDYLKCVEYCDKVIEYKIEQYNIDENNTIKRQVNTTGYNAYGYPLLSESSNSTMSTTGGSSYDVPAAYDKIFCDGNSFESIFELTFPASQSERNEAIADFYGSVNKVGAFLEASENLLGESGPSNTYSTGISDIFTTLDRRAAEGFTYPGESGNYNIRKYVASMVGVKVGTNSSSWGAGMMTNRSQDVANWIVYRLTDVMLMKAEAEVQLAGYISQNAEEDNSENENVKTRAAFGNVYSTAQEYYDDAFNIVCAVYYRASLQTSTSNIIDRSKYVTQADFVNLVEVERRRELLFEGKRYYDLVRRARREGNTNHYAECLSSKFASNASVMKIKMAMLDFMYTPYYESELDANPMLKQNPAYAQDKTTEKN